MSSMPCSNTAAERQHAREQGLLSDKADVAQAIEALTDRLKAGKQVGRCTLRDLIDGEANNADRYVILISDFEELLLAAHGEHGAKADRITEGLIERYLDSHPELVEEEAAAIEQAAAEDAE
jgi:hypothetical protein